MSPPRRKAAGPARELDLLKEITRTIAGSLDPGEVLNRIVRMTARVTGADRCNIFLAAEDGQDLVLMETTGEKREGVGAVRVPAGEELRIIEVNAAGDPAALAMQDSPDDRFEAFLSVPVVNRERVIGAINVWHRRRHHCTAQTVELVGIVAGQAGVAIANAREHQEVLKRNRQVETLSDVASSNAGATEQVRKVIAEQTAAVSQMASAAQELTNLSVELQTVVSRFRLG